PTRNSASSRSAANPLQDRVPAVASRWRRRAMMRSLIRPRAPCMKHVRVAAVTLTVLAVAGIAASRNPRPAPATIAFTRYAGALDQLDANLARLDSSLLARRNSAEVAGDLREARATYKSVELFVEYYGGPALARELNGPPIPKAEDEDPEHSLAPVGFQVLEPALEPPSDARRLIGYMRTAVASLRRMGADTMPGDAYLFDAMRQEVARVATLGLAGFDQTATSDPLVDAANALGGVLSAFAPYRVRLARIEVPALARLDSAFDSAIEQLQSASIDQFSRLDFISNHVQSIARRWQPPRRRSRS